MRRLGWDTAEFWRWGMSAMKRRKGRRLQTLSKTGHTRYRHRAQNGPFDPTGMG